MLSYGDKIQITQPEKPTTSAEFAEFLNKIQSQDSNIDYQENLLALSEVITPDKPLAYWSMEFYDQENGIKGGGGLGVLAADTRRVAEQLGIPLLVITPFYTEESHQEIQGFRQVEKMEACRPERLFRNLGRVAISTIVDDIVPLDVYDRPLGSTRILTVTEPNFGELYPGVNGNNHRLYQEVALGFGGYKAIKQQGLEPYFMQLNEAPTIFAAIAKLDDLCKKGVPFYSALEQIRQQMLYTNHTLVQAVEGEFEPGQFEHLVMPNIDCEDVRSWVRGMFLDGGKLKLSSLAIELANTKNGVSKLHARVADFKDRYGNQVEFEAVTNGISRKWILPEIMDYYHELGVLDKHDMPTFNYRDRLDSLDMGIMRRLRLKGRWHMDKVLAGRKDQYGNSIYIPDDALIYDFKRRFVEYKRPDMVFSEPNYLAYILEEQNAHFALTGLPHRDDEYMKNELTRLLYLIDANSVLRERVHYIQDYDEIVGQALAFGADCAINVPKIGEEACGTSWMKDMSNFKIVISTADGGVADVCPAACLEVNGNELGMLYSRMIEAAHIIRDDTRFKEVTTRQLKEYLPTISGPLMMADYLRLFHNLYQTAASERQVAA